MIQENELRIGNLLNYDTGEGILATKIDVQDLAWCVRDAEGFNAAHSPIPITEEWLLRLGFEFVKASVGDNYYRFISEVDFEWYENRLMFEETAWDCLYIHQLQNIIFALTGEELKLQRK